MENQAVQQISVQQLRSPHISVDPKENVAYLFFGETPRAQLRIPIEGSVYEWNPVFDALASAFPAAELTFQS